jgi:hypothetical protein
MRIEPGDESQKDLVAYKQQIVQRRTHIGDRPDRGRPAKVAGAAPVWADPGVVAAP